MNTLRALTLVGLLAAPGCIGAPVIKYSPVDQYGVVIERKQPISVGCLEVEPRLAVRKGYWYEPRFTAHLRNPADSGGTVRVVIDSLQLHSLRFDIRRADVQMPSGTGQDTLVLHPGESTKVVISYIGEWPQGHTKHEVPVDERIVIRIAGVECNGEVVPTRLQYFEVEN